MARAALNYCEFRVKYEMPLIIFAHECLPTSISIVILSGFGIQFLLTEMFLNSHSNNV